MAGKGPLEQSSSRKPATCSLWSRECHNPEYLCTFFIAIQNCRRISVSMQKKTANSYHDSQTFDRRRWIMMGKESWVGQPMWSTWYPPRTQESKHKTTPLIDQRHKKYTSYLNIWNRPSKNRSYGLLGSRIVSHPSTEKELATYLGAKAA